MTLVLKQLFSYKKVKSKDVAKDRLLAVLAHDRINLSSGELDQIKEEIIDVISRYIRIDKDGTDIALTNTLRHSRLIAQVPIISTQN